MNEPTNPSRDTPTRPRVAVVFGGRSTEHAISCVSAGSVLAVIDRDRYDVVPVGITTDGRWVLADDEPSKLAIVDGVLPSVDESGAAVALVGDPTYRQLTVREPGQVPRELGEVDVVLPLLHGPYGEDGTLQGLLELSGVPYVGSGVFASAASMDKGHLKALLHAYGLPTGPYVVVPRAEWLADPAAVSESVASLGYPVFVKPCRGGSSVGISKVSDPAQLAGAIEDAARYDPRVIVEAMVEGREIECGVLESPDGGMPDVSVLGEIVVDDAHEFYDFEAKYLGGASLAVPTELPDEVADEMRELAARAFQAFTCEGLARVDFFLTPNGRVLINEVNTMPGFTPSSMFPRVWAASGLDYPALVDRLLQTALRRTTGLR